VHSLALNRGDKWLERIRQEAKDEMTRKMRERDAEWQEKIDHEQARTE